MSTSARARSLEPSRDLANRFAELLGEPESHQLGVCARLGIVWRTHMRWMAADADPETDVAYYQSTVLAALDEQRKADLKSIPVDVEKADGAHCSVVWNMRKHRHESRFRRFYDDPAKVELTGKDGGPIQQEVAHMSVAQLQELAKQGAGDDE